MMRKRTAFSALKLLLVFAVGLLSKADSCCWCGTNFSYLAFFCLDGAGSSRSTELRQIYGQLDLLKLDRCNMEWRKSPLSAEHCA